jgi:DNA-binding response OmpR family regulator
MSFPVVAARKKRILIVEDDPDSNEILAQFFGHSYEVIVAHDGVEGVELAASTEPDLIITDVTMPRMDGVEMMRHIRGKQGLRSPVIFVSALAAPKDVIAGISAGARLHLAKPVDLAELKRRVTRALEE